MAGSVDIQRIGQIHITVSDTDRAVEFYRDKLGLKFLFRAQQMAFFDCGGVRLMLAPPEADGVRYSSILYLVVDDIEKSYHALEAGGVKTVTKPRLIAKMPDHDLWMAGFRDPDGNLLELMSEVKRK